MDRFVFLFTLPFFTELFFTEDDFVCCVLLVDFDLTEGEETTFLGTLDFRGVVDFVRCNPPLFDFDLTEGEETAPLETLDFRGIVDSDCDLLFDLT